MSIISEALKKAQAERSDDQSSPLDPPVASRAVPVAVISVITVAVIAGVVYFATRPSEKPKAAPPPAATAERSAETNEQPAEEAFSPKTYTFRDTSSENTAALPKLTGIMYSPTYPMAVLDGITVREGEVMRGMVVQKILSDRVVLSREGKEFVLKLR